MQEMMCSMLKVFMMENIFYKIEGANYGRLEENTKD